MIAGDATHAMLQRFLFPRLQLPLWATDRWVSVLLPAFLIILPLSMLRNIGALAPTSGLAVAAMTFTAATITFKMIMALARGTTSAGQPIMQDVVQWRLSASMLNAIPIMVFAYQCHVQAVSIYAELTSSPSLLPCLSRSGHPSLMKKCRGMTHVAAVAFLECSVLYIITGASGYIQFPGKTLSNILSNYDIQDDLMQAARILVGAAAMLHYPVDLHPARTALYDLACKCIGRRAVYPPPYPPIAAAAASMFCLTAVLACVLTDLGKVFQVIGGLAGSMVIFVLPGAVMIFDPVTFEGPEVGMQPADDATEQQALLPAQGGGVRTNSEPTDNAVGREPLEQLAAESRDNTSNGPTEHTGRALWDLSSIQAWGILYFYIGSMIMLLTVYLTVIGVEA